MRLKKLIKYYKQKIKTIEKDIDIFSLIPYEDDIISSPNIEQLTIYKATLQALKNLQKYKKKSNRLRKWEWGGKDE